MFSLARRCVETYRPSTKIAFLVLLFVASNKALAQMPGQGSLELLDINTAPAVVWEGRPFEIVSSGYNLATETSARVDLETNTITVGLPGYNCFSAGNPPYPPNEFPTVDRAPVAGLPAGTYTVEALWGPDCFNDTVSLTREIMVYPNTPDITFYHESPAEGEVVSGVSVIRGWACFPRDRGEVGEITFTLGESGFHFPLPHGSVRQDTAEVCGDYDPFFEPVLTGYGAVIYWPTTGPEEERSITLYHEGEVMDSVNFFVAQPPATDVPEDSGFRKGAEGEYVVENFLGTEEVVTIRWSEAAQNFVIVDYR